MQKAISMLGIGQDFGDLLSYRTKVTMAIRIERAMKRVVWQNIALTFGVKVIVLALGAGSLAMMKKMVFTDVGVALLVILNPVQVQQVDFISN